MDRQTVVEVSNILNQGKIPNNSLQIIVEYCREKDKQEDAIPAFISNFYGKYVNQEVSRRGYGLL